MIFVKLQDETLAYLGPGKIPTHIIYSASEVFKFEEGKTVYYKDRYKEYYQYEEDEIIILKLTQTFLKLTWEMLRLEIMQM